MIKKLILGMILFIVATYYMLVTYFGDVQINKYDSKSAVKEEQAIERGWVPNILPDSAFEISETHDLDSNQLFGSFSYKEPDEKKLLAQLTVIPDMNGTMEWGNFFFKIDKTHNHVKYRNKADLPRNRT